MAAVPNSILDTTKKALGIFPEDNVFDDDIIMHINSVFTTLHQLGVGPDDGFEIEDNSLIWADYFGGNKLINSVRTLVYLQTRLYFDPPTTSFDLSAKRDQIKELQWRLNVAADKNLVYADGVPDNWGDILDDFVDGLVDENPLGEKLIHRQEEPRALWVIPVPSGKMVYAKIYLGTSFETSIRHLPDETVDNVYLEFPHPSVGVAILTFSEPEAPNDAP